jgi:hypothetical protein
VSGYVRAIEQVHLCEVGESWHSDVWTHTMSSVMEVVDVEEIRP